MSNRISQNLVTVEVRTIMQMKITIPIITIIMKKKTRNKTDFNESSQKTAYSNTGLAMKLQKN